MPDNLDSELEKLVATSARELAREITHHILKRLGVGAGGKAQAPAPVKGKPGPKPKGLNGVAHKANGVAKAAAKAGAPAKRGPGRPPGGSADRSALLGEVERLVTSSDGVSLGDLERKSKFGRSALASALRTLKDERRIFMGGTRRFARYAATQAQADRANVAARQNA